MSSAEFLDGLLDSLIEVCRHIRYANGVRFIRELELVGVVNIYGIDDVDPLVLRFEADEGFGHLEMGFFDYEGGAFRMVESPMFGEQ